MARSMRAAGCRPGMMVHVAYGYGLFTGGLGAHDGAQRLGCAVVPVSGGMTERQVQLITDFKPDVVMVTPSYMLAIVDEMRKLGLNPRKCSLKIGIFGAEPWTNAMREEMESELDIDALDIYGLSEVIGPGVASECVETKDGPTVWEDHFYPEIVDPATGAVLPDGEHGELVLTSLTKEAMPVIRYRTRDLTPAAAGHRAHDAADGEGHRPLRRHDHPARRQRLSRPRSRSRSSSAAVSRPITCIELGREGRLDTMNVLVEARPERGRPGDARLSRSRSSPITSRRWSASRCASPSSTPARSTARSARPSASSTCGRRTRRGSPQTQPASSRRATVSITRMPSSLSLRQGSAANCLAAGLVEIAGVLDADLLQRLEAVGGEAGRQHGERA